MARGPDGKTIRPGGGRGEEATRKVPRKSIKDRIAGSDPAGEAATRIADTRPSENDGTMGRESKEGYVEDDATLEDGPSSAPPEASEAKTQVYRPQRQQSAEEPKAEDEPEGETKDVADDQTVADPVVGWVVVIDGPGRGNAFSLGYGNNRVGRDESQRVSLDFGDGQISRENHATITFDGKNGRFFIKEGDGRNLTYVGDDPVLVPVQLKGNELLTMGVTKLKFVPFCGEDFSWESK